MGLFSGIKNNMRKAEAAVLIQKLLEHQAQLDMYPEFDPATMATKLIASAWDGRPEAFDGSLGGDRPHKLSIAVYALANAIDSLNPDGDLRDCLIMPFVRLIAEVQQNGRLYPLNQVGSYLLEPSRKVYAKLENEMGDLLGEMGQLD